MHIVVACGAGMGTSMLIRLKVEKILRDKKVSAKVEALSVGGAKPMTNTADLIITQTHLLSQFDTHNKAKIVGIKNATSEKEILEAIENFLANQK
ncbi:PTS system ascorbate-specific IIB component [Mycoplasmoides fastidiosum]|uniref:PTS system ascorbate-specific IIB component n=1 Tax=Mycoplasmoides fastidiosum TaxID=92758 RepID=A0ABU0LZG6_9BACT|nr:PTS sugar transporter subunit IIB [Mycoplasmoides fastidiosum]MDQ0514104.1 PTS system ascorbate-specific IIB component [Mycoplasmoides fastidiosum]UUD37488.1 PTS sugar transporter subunit IIB [Mycoplasmoides fastidiosum]